MGIGYACQIAGPEGYGLRTCAKKNATEDKLREIITHNLETLDRMVDYNIRRGIRLFRISSDIIPFGSSPVNTLPWAEEYRDLLAAVGGKAVKAGMRLSMHPGQYTVLNSPSEEVRRNAVEDLSYHTRFLDAMGLDGEHKLIVHIGGAYGDKASALRRFVEEYIRLDQGIRRRLIIENDDRIFHVQDVLWAAERGDIPVVFDVLHHQVNGCGVEGETAAWIRRCGETWREKDGRPKIHYSQQEPGKKPGSHSETIAVAEFLELWDRLEADRPDIMLEVKDKNLSAVKCIHCTDPTAGIGELEREWGRYKYTVLERDPAAYQEIRNLLKDKAARPALELYGLVERALRQPPGAGEAVNAAQHVWGYFKQEADPRERARFQRELEKLRGDPARSAPLKRFLHSLALKYQQPYLLDSYYFSI